MLDRRLQLLIDEGRHERLTSESRRTGTPVGELVRRAIDREYPGDLDDRRGGGTLHTRFAAPLRA